MRDRLAVTAGRVVDTVLDRAVVVGYSRWGYAIRRRLPGWPPDVAAGAMSGRSAVVTGASSGLGAETVAAFARLGAEVHLVVRDRAKGERVRATVAASVAGARLRVWRCDVSDVDDITRLTDRLGAEQVDVVVHNAGVLPPERRVSAQAHELTLATHVLGPLRMTELLRPALRASDDARVIWVASGGMYAHRLPVADPEYTEPPFAGATAYARTKRIQVALTPLLARRWAADGIAVYAMHPGWANTPGVADSLPGFYRLTRRILRDPEQGADTVVWLAAADPPPASGQFWHDRRPRPAHLLPWTRHTDDDAETMLARCLRAARLD